MAPSHSRILRVWRRNLKAGQVAKSRLFKWAKHGFTQQPVTNALSGDDLARNIPFSKGCLGPGRNNEDFFRILIIPGADRLQSQSCHRRPALTRAPSVSTPGSPGERPAPRGAWGSRVRSCGSCSLLPTHSFSRSRVTVTAADLDLSDTPGRPAPAWCCWEERAGAEA